MPAQQSHIIAAINTSPLNRGLSGADWLASDGNIPITFANGDIMLFTHEGDGIYFVHLFFTAAHGREAIIQARAGFAQMFDQHRARAIFGLVPNFSRHVKIFSRMIGGRSLGIINTPDGACEKFVLTSAMWKAN